jgi:hypothetical protein
MSRPNLDDVSSSLIFPNSDQRLSLKAALHDISFHSQTNARSLEEAVVLFPRVAEAGSTNPLTAQAVSNLQNRSSAGSYTVM